jgi:putative transposase
MSNVKARGRYHSEKRATLTVRELDAWLTLEIAGRYHHSVHRGIHMTPAAAWGEGIREPTKPFPEET